MRKNLPSDQDDDLVRRMASKDVTALDTFYERYNGLAFSPLLKEPPETVKEQIRTGMIYLGEKLKAYL